VDFAALQTELYSRGSDYLSDDGAGQTRAKRFLNDAYTEICEAAAWPFLETTTTQNVPYTFTNLRHILSVHDPRDNFDLRGVDQENLREWYSDLTTAGQPTYWYLVGDQLKVFPVGTDTYELRYIKVPAELVSDTDTPVLPSRFHRLIVHGAMLQVLEDRDDYELIAGLQARYDSLLARMADSLLGRGQSTFLPSGGDYEYA